MNEFEYEVFQRKRLASQAKYKKNGSKSKKCSLSTDHMTHKQWTERNGRIMSYSINRPLSWADFKELPKDLKEEYLNNLIEKYSVNKKNLADMFGVSHVTLFRLVEKEALNVKFARGRHPSKEQLGEFNSFLLAESQIAEQPVDIVPVEAVAERVSEEVCVVELPTAVDPVTTRLNAFTMDFSGPIDVDMIANSLRYILGASSNAVLKIECVLNA